MLFVVGIFDFSGAISLKQKLTNTARESARVAAADPASDLSGSASGVPASVSDAFWVVDNYLVSEKLGDCGLSSVEPVRSPSSLTWISTATAAPCGASAALMLKINRGCYTPTTINGNTVNLAATCVTIQYPYYWQFGGVSGLTGGTFVGPTTITVTATAFNEN